MDQQLASYGYGAYATAAYGQYDPAALQAAGYGQAQPAAMPTADPNAYAGYGGYAAAPRQTTGYEQQVAAGGYGVPKPSYDQPITYPTNPQYAAPTAAVAPVAPALAGAQWGGRDYGGAGAGSTGRNYGSSGNGGAGRGYGGGGRGEYGSRDFKSAGGGRDEQPRYGSGGGGDWSGGDRGRRGSGAPYGDRGGARRFDNQPGRGRSDDFGGGGGGYGGGDGDGGPPQMETMLDTIFVSNLPKSITAEQLRDHFGALGVIKIDKKTNEPRIRVYTDKITGEGKGEATVTYDDPPSANAAIEWFNGQQAFGTVIRVELAQRPAFVRFGAGGRGDFRGRGRGGGRGDFRGGRGGPPRDYGGGGGGGSGGPPSSSAGAGGVDAKGNTDYRPGDWVCPPCGNNNFGWRQNCNRCGGNKPDGDGPSDGNGASSMAMQSPLGNPMGGSFRGGGGGGGGFSRGRGGGFGGDRGGRGGRGGFGGDRGGRGDRGGDMGKMRGGPDRMDRRPKPY